VTASPSNFAHPSMRQFPESSRTLSSTPISTAGTAGSFFVASSTRSGSAWLAPRSLSSLAFTVAAIRELSNRACAGAHSIGLQRTAPCGLAAAEAGSLGTPGRLVSDGVASSPAGVLCARRPRRSARRLVARNGERTGSGSAAACGCRGPGPRWLVILEAFRRQPCT